MVIRIQVTMFCDREEGLRVNNILHLLTKNRGITQKQLAEKTGIHPSLISQIVNGRVAPTDEELEKICVELGVTPSQIYPDDSMREAMAE
jgi:transcriptional regulator with XRE-family HTH domain